MDLPVIPEERGSDLIGLEWVDEADLILFMAGNQFMAMPALLEAFRRLRPEARRIFLETLPPGLELKQILAGGALFQGRRLPGIPDCYTSVSKEAMKRLSEAGYIEAGEELPYLHNRIVLLVRKGNPKNIIKVEDLGREDVRVSQPNPEGEHIARHILRMYRKAGGDDLVRRIMEEKLKEGTTLFTVVHHRETPERLLSGEADVGPVWATEAAEAERKGLPLEAVEPGEELDQRESVTYYAALPRPAPHPELGRAFRDFLISKEAQEIFAAYGFIPERSG